MKSLLNVLLVSTNFTGRIDPIVSPGSIASHTHLIAGPTNFGLSSTYEDLFNASCTTCEIQDDKSAYWTPQLYYAHANGSFEEVGNSGMTVYYLGRGVNRTNIKPFPEGFRMISGNTFARSYNTAYTFGGQLGMTLANGSCSDDTGTCSGNTFVNGSGNGQTFLGRPLGDAVSFKCLGGNETETPGLQYTNCSYGLRAQLQFQSCWDGVNLYKSDNSHVAYMSQIDNGVCPPTHPVQFAHLFFEVHYQTDSIKELDGFFVFANGDKTGYGFHGDFMNGWNMTTQASALEQCVNAPGAGTIQECAPLMLSDDRDSTRGNCSPPPPLIAEAVRGMLSQLPGCNRIETSPASASPADHTCPQNSIQPSLNPTPKPVYVPVIGDRSGNSTYVGCANDDVSNRTLGDAWNFDNQMTIEQCLSFCSQKGFTLAGLEYATQCFCGSALAANGSLGHRCGGMVCGGNQTQICGGPNLLSVWKMDG